MEHLLSPGPRGPSTRIPRYEAVLQAAPLLGDCVDDQPRFVELVVEQPDPQVLAYRTNSAARSEQDDAGAGAHSSAAPMPMSGTTERARIEFKHIGATQLIQWDFNNDRDLLPLCGRIERRAEIPRGVLGGLRVQA